MTAVRLHVWETLPSRIHQYIHVARKREVLPPGAALPDPDGLLQGTGKFMRHVKLKPGMATNAAALSKLIEMAYADIKNRVENG